MYSEFECRPIDLESLGPRTCCIIELYITWPDPIFMLRAYTANDNAPEPNRVYICVTADYVAS